MQPWVSLCAPWSDAESMRPGDGCTSCSVVTDDTPDDEDIESALLEASEYLHAVSGFKFTGVCEGVARPCAGDDDWLSGIYAWAPIPWYFPPGVFPAWWGAGCGCGFGSCDCCGPPGVTLGRVPVLEVSEVKIDGEILDEDEYRLVDNILVRLDPDDPTHEMRWGCCQRLDLPDTEVGTWSVAFTWGAEPPALGALAARDLACVLLKARCGDSECQPVQNLVRQTRGGVTVEVQSPIGEVRTLLPESARLFLDAYGTPYRQGPRIRRPQVGCGIIVDRSFVYGAASQRWGFGAGCAGC